MRPRPPDFWVQVFIGIAFPWFMAIALAISLTSREDATLSHVAVVFAVATAWTLSFGAFLLFRLRRWRQSLLLPQRIRPEGRVWTGFWSTLLRWLWIALVFIALIVALLFVGAAVGGRGG